MTLSDIFGLLGYLVFLTHGTVSFRSRMWLPLLLGRGLTPEHPSVHLRVALCNLYYCLLMVGLATGYLDPRHSVPLTSVLYFGGLYCIVQFLIRGLGFLRTMHKA